MAIIAEHPDFYLWQYQELLRERLGIDVSTVTIHNFLKKQGMTLKKDLPQRESPRRGGAKRTTSLSSKSQGYSSGGFDYPRPDRGVGGNGTGSSSEFTGSKSLSLSSEIQGGEAYGYWSYFPERSSWLSCHQGWDEERGFLEFLRSELCPKLEARKVVIMDNL